MIACILTLGVLQLYLVVADINTYTAAVVEYYQPTDPSLDPTTNILQNVAKYVEFINLANNKAQVDIIVFPEVGLQGYSIENIFMEVPDPEDGFRLCANETTYHAVLVQLSCAARATATYVVVNLAERFFNHTQNRTLYFNSDVVFDRGGVVVARYRKIHLFNEGGLQSSADQQLVFFDTDFGVRFGLLTCFDIIFKTPGVDLANNYNVTHFVFPTAWFSEMPFLTAIQEQNYWAYTLDVVLLAAGYNQPSYGSTGSGIYLGRRGAITYNMTGAPGSFIIYADVPIVYHGSNTFASQGRKGLETGQVQPLHTSSQELKLKRDYLEVYTTEPIVIPFNDSEIINSTDIAIPFTVERSLCQNTLCCNFSLRVRSEFSREWQTAMRQDDYSSLYYRLAVFDGVRSYGGVDTGGVQTCAIIPCTRGDLSSCALTPDDTTQPNKLLDFCQTQFTFQSIKISGNFSNNHSFVGPNVLLGGEYTNFGSLMSPQLFRITEDYVTEGTVVKTFQTVESVNNLVTASLYGRLFFRDGQNYTGQPSNQTGSKGSGVSYSGFTIILSIYFCYYFSLTHTTWLSTTFAQL